ncbi:MAG: DUF1553 domain-containing protein [Verrucomicrobia bacterium]|nr:DUF1553 domain-containing protein [Verrucomicrobiota bacterium]MBI3871053.1 DUF1553 domain-containing protein [Verrucomicrobiota bacterium]
MRSSRSCRPTLPHPRGGHPSLSSSCSASIARWLCGLYFAVVVCVFALASRADEATGASGLSVLRQHCFGCHSHDARSIQGGLALDSRASAGSGGDSGKPAWVAGHPEESRALLVIAQGIPGLRRAHENLSVPSDRATVLAQWIRDGALFPSSSLPKISKVSSISDSDREWWAFQPLKATLVPSERLRGWGRNEVDRFVGDRLASAGIEPQSEASKEALFRRLSFDLWGLPPLPSDLAAFMADEASDAYERWVDRLLEDRRYGERWARHWLDLVRYADSDGYRVDDFRPNAWRYRDYVIRSLNADKPYSRFVQEQLAGDELWPEDPDALIATGYLRHGIYEYNNRDAVAQWSTLLNDITDTTAEVMLGLGLQCARCHDHKFDPLLQKDYFRLQAFFAGMLPYNDTPAATPAQRAEHQRKLDAYLERTRELQDQIRRIEEPYRQQASDDLRSKFPAEIQALMRKPQSERTPYEHQVAELAYRQVTHAYERLAPRIKPQDKEKLAAVQKQLAAFSALMPAPLPQAMTVTEVGPVAPALAIPKKGPAPIEPGFPTILDPGDARIERLPSAPGSTGRRATLARWITEPANPLSSRVIVNRVWQYHFGRGLVRTSSDFGRLGEKPTHPELLDWLAQRFVTDGWSLKKLHRLILTSATYRLSSTAPSPGLASAWKKAQQLDPENRLLWRGTARRLDAEQVRDAVLMASGELSRAAGGAPADASKFQRSVFTKVLRNSRDPLLDAFDAPQAFSSASQRDVTTTPMQSLLMINSPFMIQRAQAMARRIGSDHPGDIQGQMLDAYRWVYGREARTEELKAADAFWRGQARRVDAELAFSASSGLQTDRFPFRDGKAVVISPSSAEQALSIPMRNIPRGDGDFTLEAFVYLHTVPDDASTRTLAARWPERPQRPSWVVGVTGKKSHHKPQSLFLEFAGTGPQAQPVQVFSDLPLRIDKPHYVAVAVHRNGDSAADVTFHLKDISNDDEPLASARISASAPRITEAFHQMTLGGRVGGGASWDGMIDDVRLSLEALSADQLMLAGGEAVRESTVGLWQFESNPGYYKDASRRGNDIQPAATHQARRMSPEALALADFCHALMNSSEFLYIE